MYFVAFTSSCIKANAKKDAREWLKNLSVGKDDYIDEHRQRIMELNEQRRDLWELVRKYKKSTICSNRCP
jgi:disulfide oxidoreductase YuzD